MPSWSTACRSRAVARAHDWSSSGRLPRLVAGARRVAVTYQNQLDEIARGLIQAIAESDQSATPTLPDVPGLFTWDGRAGDAAVSGSVPVGLAGTIKLNASVDPAQGGNAARLRDGGISNPGNPAYVYNATGACGYSDRLNQLLDAWTSSSRSIRRPQAAPIGNVSGFAASSVAWLQAGPQIRRRRRRLQEHAAQPVLGCAVQRHRRQPR